MAVTKLTKSELLEKISKKEESIKKIENRIKKWSNNMCKEAIDIAKSNISYSEFNTYYKNNSFREDVIRQDGNYNKGPNIIELRSAYQDLKTAQDILEKLKLKLNEVEAFENQEKISVIWDFLEDWRKKVHNYIVDEVKVYQTLKENFYDAQDKYLCEKLGDNYNTRDNYWKICSYKTTFFRLYYLDISPLCKEVYTHNGNYDDVKLNRLLDAEVKRRYQDFIKRISEKCGKIIDATNLRMGPKGTIDGVVLGTKAKVKVETIGAGGYNIQCFHYRILVNKLSK